jgi:hypothetical protein
VACRAPLAGQTLAIVGIGGERNARDARHQQRGTD